MVTDKNQNIYPIAIVYDDNNRKGVVLKIEYFNKTGTCVDINQHFKIVVIENTEKNPFAVCISEREWEILSVR